MKSIPSRAIAQLIEQLARAIHSASHAHGLYPAQWTALRFFSTADKQHRTATALTRYQGIAFGPVSRTVRTLIVKKLIRRQRGESDQRIHSLELTARGTALLKQDPLNVLTKALDGLGSADRRALVVGLEAALRTLASRDSDIALDPNA